MIGPARAAVALARSLTLAGTGAALARAGVAALSSSRSASLRRVNYRDRPVSLAAGPALTVAASVSAAVGPAIDGRNRLAAAALVAGLGAGATGYYDDVAGAGAGHGAKGFRGHLGALREGRVTSGVAKIAGVGVASLAAAALLPGRPGRGQRGRAAEVVLAAGVIAGTANLANLLDLRPGRTLKAGLIVGVPLCAGGSSAVVAGPVGAAAALLPRDLAENVMLGDCGANALGAVLGVALAARTGLIGRTALLAGLTALTAASERVSITGVIESTPGLRWVDRIGRRT